MKRIQLKTFIASGLLTVLFLAGCKKVLEEEPRSTFTPEYFKTEAGFNGG